MSLVESTLDERTGIVTLTINRPEVLNAIDVPLARALNGAVLALRDDVRVRCVLIRGAGRAFVAGGDLAAFAEDFDRAADVADDLLDALHPVAETLRAIDAPVIAAVHGAVAGAGLSLTCSCDLAIAAQGTRFLMAYDKVGAAPDFGGTYFLPRVLGPRRAAQFLFLSETLDADAALAAGLVNRVVPAEQLDAVVDEIARRIAAGPTRAYGQYKRLADRAFERDLHDQLEAERVAFKNATRTEDFREGVGAFLAKRAPRFSGR
ncbi:MAG: enoyl-CoA hydratase [Panacagrimonas sp.]|jgi:2-(1,2-epoxy-1,2-dihydrophenyl)acetyl-CoA isomerase|nr:enoyl-CoA hydratase-related protein [Panacagrimonas sp.]MCC2655148.1 enoyl-CoA hydratase [Panacagrimonas sp.]